MTAMTEQVTLFHGSNQAFDVIDLSKAKDKRDFGRGFYTTTLKAQAEDWAKIIRQRLGGDASYLYEISFRLADGLNVRRFSDLTSDWLEMIKQNRVYGGVQHDYDAVIGPVANDNTFRTVTLYLGSGEK
ncbi:MAG: DUF3990 domain-containing protein [Clostridiales Family XIII bacterium]|jgi:hypothetical protein|nr:DUF3990 domain-containing protein [Clostridiales Family XIII bacterium]